MDQKILLAFVLHHLYSILLHYGLTIEVFFNSRPHISDIILKQIHRQPVIAFLKNTVISNWDWKDQGPWKTEDLGTYAAVNTNTS